MVMMAIMMVMMVRSSNAVLGQPPPYEVEEKQKASFPSVRLNK